MRTNVFSLPAAAALDNNLIEKIWRRVLYPPFLFDGNSHLMLYFAAVSLLLHIDSAVEGASVCLSKDEEIISYEENKNVKDSAAWLQNAIKQLLNDQNYKPADIAAISVSEGPGSYTGLRVGMASAKGLCYALSIPLITINTLEMMATAALPAAKDLLCPMIDARRVEVFTAIFDKSLNTLKTTTNLVLTPESFQEELKTHHILFFGNGSNKFASMLQHPNAQFVDITANAKNLVPIATERFKRRAFANLAYSEPNYAKDFYTPLSGQQQQ